MGLGALVLALINLAFAVLEDRQETNGAGCGRHEECVYAFRGCGTAQWDSKPNGLLLSSKGNR